MRESDFQSKLIRRLKKDLPGCLVIKNDPNYIQGFPDLLVLYKDKWAALECKRNLKARHQPNQDDYIFELNKMSYAAFVSPENEEEILHELQSTFEP